MKPTSPSVEYRLSCCVPHCGCSISRSEAALKTHEEWICAEHWAMIDPARRAAYARYLRRPLYPSLAALWAELKAEAVEHAARISKELPHALA